MASHHYQVWVAPEIALDSRERGLQSRYRRERWLLIAVLQNALCDLFQFLPHASPADRLDAESWFFSRSREPFSFGWICEQLGLDCVELSECLRRWQRTGPPRRLCECPQNYLSPLPGYTSDEDFFAPPPADSEPDLPADPATASGSSPDSPSNCSASSASPSVTPALSVTPVRTVVPAHSVTPARSVMPVRSWLN